MNVKYSEEKEILYNVNKYSLESAGEGGFMVSGLRQSGLGERSLFGTPCELLNGPMPLCDPSPSIETPFSERNSSKSTY